MKSKLNKKEVEYLLNHLENHLTENDSDEQMRDVFIHLLIDYKEKLSNKFKTIVI